MFGWLLKRGVADLRRSLFMSRATAFHIEPMFKYIFSEVDNITKTLKTQEAKKEDKNDMELKYYRLCEARNNLCIQLKLFEQSLMDIPLGSIREMQEWKTKLK